MLKFKKDGIMYRHKFCWFIPCKWLIYLHSYLRVVHFASLVLNNRFFPGSYMYFVLCSTFWSEEAANAKSRTHMSTTLLNHTMRNMGSHNFTLSCVYTCERETTGVHANSFVCLFVDLLGSHVATVTEHSQQSAGSSFILSCDISFCFNHFWPDHVL